ncbi:MAG: DUF2341 domain-containing protein [Gammaproteobacteria bacterium]|nr:DUF2341 domain-containing protein [Gammaproteobacteria bacterium]
MAGAGGATAATDDKTIQINAAGGVCAAPGQAWYDSAWAYRKGISIDKNKVTATLSSFPVLINLGSDADLAADAQVDFDDILFTASDGTTKLSHEIEKYNEATGELVVWVKVPSLSSTVDTVLYLYYGNATVASQQDPANVWDANYQAVWHLKEDPSGSAPQMKDSTSPPQHGTSQGTMTASDQVAGKIGGSLDLDGTDDRVSVGMIVGNSTAFTASAWFRTSATAIAKIWAEGNSTTTTPVTNVQVNEPAAGDVRFSVRDDASADGTVTFSGGSYNNGSWHHVVGVQRAKNDRELFIDGVSKGTSTVSLGTVTLNTGNIGANERTTLSNYLSGLVDEVRVSNIARSAAWVATEFKNQNNPANFYSLCSEEVVPVPASLSSAANQTFTVGDPVTAISTITVTDASLTATITAANDLRIRIPSTFNMIWDTSDTSALIGGNSAAKVSGTVSYADSRTLVINVTSNFAAGGQIMVSGLSFISFTAASAANNLTLDVDNNGSADASDAKTIQINAAPVTCTWYDPTWKYRQPLTIQGSQVTASLSNFAVLVSVTNVLLKDTANSGHVGKANGGDILFTTSDGTTKLDHEIESYNPATGTLLAWVKVPSLSASSNTSLFMYYGNAAAADQQSVSGTWDGSYEIIYHLNGNFLDSTTKARHGTDVGTAAATGVAGNARQFVRSESDYINSNWAPTFTGNLTVEGWFKALAQASTGDVWGVEDRGGGDNSEIRLGIRDDAITDLDGANNEAQSYNIELRPDSGDIISQTGFLATNVDDGNWHHIALVREGTTGRLYYDGGVVTLVDSSVAAGTSSYPVTLLAGAQWQTDTTGTRNHFNGVLDELRVSTVARSAGYFATQRNNVSAPGSFVTFGTEVERGVTLSSALSQTFAVGDPATAISTITITDQSSANSCYQSSITASNDLRIRIPSTFNMTWDSADTTATIGGGAAAKVSGTVSYEDGNKTLVLDVTTNFAAGDSITVAGLSFNNFTAASNADNLELEVGNDNAVAALDDKTVTVKLAANFRSIGINSGILYQIGTATINAGGSTVTFAGATLPTNIGLGDKLVIGDIPPNITLRNKTNTSPTSTTLSVAGTKPTGTVQGDLMIATAVHDGGNTNGISAPAGWIRLQPAGAPPYGAEDMRTHTWYKVAGASEPSTYTFTMGGSTLAPMIVQIASFYSTSGVNVNGWTLQDSSYNYEAIADTVSATTSVTSTTSSLLFAAFSNDGSRTVTSAPSGMTLLNAVTDSTTTPSLSLASYYENVATPAAQTRQLTWAGATEQLAAVAAIFSWTAATSAETFYILSRDSASQVRVQGTAASAHTGETYTIKRAYNTFQTWEDDRDGGLVAESRSEVGVAYNDGAFTAGAVIDGSTTDASHTMRLTVASGHGHTGIAGTGVVLDGGNTDQGIRVQDNYTVVEGFEFKRNRGGADASSIVVQNATNVLLDRLLIRDFYDNTQTVSGILAQSNSGYTARNCIIYDGDRAGIRNNDITATGIVENCTIYNMRDTTGVGVLQSSGSLTVKNTISVGNTSADFNLSGTINYFGYNMYSTTANFNPASYQGNNQSPPANLQDLFVATASGSEDLHLESFGHNAVGTGLDLSGIFTIDIDMQTRDCFWEMGADEAVIAFTNLVHFEISHDGTGINCQVEPVTITVHDCRHNPLTSYTGTVNLSISTAHGDWSKITANGTLNNGTVNDGAATYKFSVADSGAVVLGLKDTYPETVGINVASGSVTEDAGEDPPLTFYEAGFNFLANAGTTIGTQIAGKSSNVAPGAQTLKLQAIRTDTETGECKAALQGVNLIGLAMQCKDPKDCTASKVTIDAGGGPVAIASNSTGSSLTFTPVGMDFGDATQDSATYVLSYPDAGQIQLHAQYAIPLGDGSASPNLMEGGSNQFVVRPFGFDIDFSNDRESNGTGGTSYAADASGSLFKKAGEVFDTTVTAVVWQSGDDVNADGLPDSNANLTNNAATPNFGQEKKPATVKITHTLVAPIGQNVGTLQGGQNVSGFANGALTTKLSWNEVGIISLAGNHTNYLKQGGVNITGTVGNVGRFYPARVDVTDNKPMLRNGTGTWSCNFTYMDQPFGYLTPPVFTVTAKDISGNTTRNYGGPFWKFTGLLGNRAYANTVTAAAATFNAPKDGTVVLAGTSDYDGQGTLTINNETFTYQRSTAPQVKFNARALLTLNASDLTDSDGVCRSTSNRTCNTGDGDTGEGYAISNITGTELRFGRLLVESAFGSGLYPLPVPLRTEYYDGANFVPHTDDNCTKMTKLNLILSNEDQAAQTDGDILVDAATTTAGFANNPFSQGEAGLSFSPPGPTNGGYVDVTPDLPGLGMTWLRFDWDSDGSHDDNPEARVSFGLFEGPAQFIYIREPWN